MKLASPNRNSIKTPPNTPPRHFSSPIGANSALKERKISSSDRYIPSRSSTNLEDAFDMMENKESRVNNCKPEGAHENNSLNSLLRSELLGQQGTEYSVDRFDSQVKSPARKESSSSSLFKYRSSLESSSDPRSSIGDTGSFVQTNSPTRNPTAKKTTRKISKTPYKVLDAPALQDDYYLNLVDWSHNNILAVALGSCVYLWSACTSKVTKLCDLGENDAVTSINWALTGNQIAVGTNSGKILIWDSIACKMIRELCGHESRVGTLAWNTTLLASGSRDRNIYLQDIRVSGGSSGSNNYNNRNNNSNYHSSGNNSSNSSQHSHSRHSTGSMNLNINSPNPAMFANRPSNAHGSRSHNNNNNSNNNSQVPTPHSTSSYTINYSAHLFGNNNGSTTPSYSSFMRGNSSGNNGNNNNNNTNRSSFTFSRPLSPHSNNNNNNNNNHTEEDDDDHLLESLLDEGNIIYGNNNDDDETRDIYDINDNEDDTNSHTLEIIQQNDSLNYSYSRDIDTSESLRLMRSSHDHSGNVSHNNDTTINDSGPTTFDLSINAPRPLINRLFGDDMLSNDDTFSTDIAPTASIHVNNTGSNSSNRRQSQLWSTLGGSTSLLSSASSSPSGHLLHSNNNNNRLHHRTSVLSSQLIQSPTSSIFDNHNHHTNNSTNTVPVSNASLVRELSAHRQEVCGLKWSFDEKMLASGGNDNKLFVWDARQGRRHTTNSSQSISSNEGGDTEPLCRFEDHLAAVKAVAWSPHQHGLLASGGGTADRHIRFWNASTNVALHKIDTGSQVCNLMWSKNVNEIVSTHGYSLNQVIVWKYPSMQKIATLTGHSLRVLYLAMSPDGQSIVTGAGDETLRFWNVFPGPRHKSSVYYSKSSGSNGLLGGSGGHSGNSSGGIMIGGGSLLSPNGSEIR